MSNELATTQPKASALALMAARCNVEPAKLHNTLKNTVFKGASDDELLALVVTANTYNLNPLLKELYAFQKKGGGIVPLVGLDGWLKIANRQPNYDGMEVEVFGEGPKPTHATCALFLKDRAHPVTITEYFDECKRATDPWNQMPRRMLRNKVIIQAIRVAFGVGGIHDEDEAADIAAQEPRNVTPAQAKRNPFAKTLPAPKLEPEPAIDEPLDMAADGAEVAQDEMPI
jgi:phage recombination protein Bet